MLTDEQINAAYAAAEKSEPYSGAPTRKSVARAIEAELRKQYDALIRQMLVALTRPVNSFEALELKIEAVKAARARLGEC